MRHREHPQPEALHRFLRGEASPSERRAIVRHLLAGCGQCAAVTRPVWLLAEGIVPVMEAMKGDDMSLLSTAAGREGPVG